MAKQIIKLRQNIPQAHKKIKVAAYVRVSDDSDDLLRSYARQVEYYTKLISNNPEWECAGIFADKGISGTAIKKRDAFKEMLAECENGNIEIILTKSISRFARNTVDLLETVRHLKEIGIEVRFEKENINSLSNDGELMLTILASFAQEESRSISENVKWGIRKKNEKGMNASGMHRILGYKPVDGEFQVVPEEAEIVRRIFQMFNNGFEKSEICRILNDEGLRSPTGREFLEVNIDYLLRNEMYIGDRLTNKFYTENSLTHKHIRNHGEVEQFYIQGDHPAIIDSDVFERTQRLIQERHDRRTTNTPFSKLLSCGYCGEGVFRKKYEKTVVYACRVKTKNRNACVLKRLREENLIEAATVAMELDEFNPFEVKNRIKAIVLYNERIEFTLNNGRKFTWQRL